MATDRCIAALLVRKNRTHFLREALDLFIAALLGAQKPHTLFARSQIFLLPRFLMRKNRIHFLREAL